MRLRQGFSAALAALCVGVLVSSCKIDNIAKAHAVAIDVGNLIAVKDTVIGNCSDTLKVGTIGPISNGGLTLAIGDERNVKAYIASGCTLTEDFDWTSSAPSVATVVSIDNTTGHIRAISNGTAIICAVWKVNRDFKLCFPVTVQGGTGGNTNIIVGPIGQALSSCPESPRTLQMTVSPGGVSGTWSVSGIAGATVSSSGVLTVPQGSVGVVVVTFTQSNGAVGSVTVSVNANCVSNPVTVGPVGQVVSTCSESPRTLQMTVNPVGTAGVWAISGVSGATISSSGLLSVPQGSSGLVVVTFTPTNGNTASVSVSVSNSSCTANPTISVNPTSLTLNFGSTCPAATATFAVNVTGVTNPSIGAVATSNSGVVTATANGLIVTVITTGGGSANISGSINGYPGLTFSVPVTVTTVSCAPNPTISVNPTSLILNQGTGCPVATSTFVVNVTGVTNPILVNLVSSNTGVATVTSNGLVVTVATVGGGTANITGSINGYPSLTFTVPITVTTNTCGGSGGLITFSPPTVCLSTVNGATSAQVTVSATGMPAGTVVNVVSGNPGVVTVSPSSISAPSGVITLTRVSTPGVNTNVTITASGNGAQNAMNVAVLTTACGNSTIDYTPPGGSINFTTITLNAVVVIGSDNLSQQPHPFWTSSNPELLSVRGNESQPITIGGINYYWGFTATLTRVANIPSGRQIEICVQWYPDFGANPKGCHIWTAP